MTTIREHILQLMTPTDAPLPVADLPGQVREAIADCDRATAALREAQAERQHLQTAALEGPVDVAGMTAAFTELDAGIRDAETAVHAADARLHAIERAAHQLLLQHRRAAALQAQEEARAAEERKHELRAREAVLQQELKDLAEHLRRAGHEISRAVAVAAEQGRRGRVRKDVSLTSGATRDAVPRTWPIRLSEWQRLWDGARAVGADYVEITLDLDSGLATDLVRPNELPGFVVQINAQHIGEIQR